MAFFKANHLMSKIDGQSFAFGQHLKRDRYSEDHKKLVELLTTNKDVFATKLDKSSRLNNVSFPIRLSTSSPIINVKAATLSDEKSQVMKQIVDELLEAGVLEKSDSEWASFAFIKNINGKPKLCVDYKELNGRTFEDNHYLPDRTEIVSSIKELGLYSKIVLCNGYHQIRLDKDSSLLTAFDTAFGKYQFTTLKDGLLNSKRHLNYALESVFENDKELDRNSMAIYLDQILIFTKDHKEHLELLAKVLGRLKEVNLKVDNSNSHFLTREVVFLGARLSTHDSKASADKEAINKIRRYRDPRNQRDLIQFLDLIEKYKTYSNDYNTPSIRLLQKLAKTNRNVFWGDREAYIFNNLKLSFLY